MSNECLPLSGCSGRWLATIWPLQPLRRLSGCSSAIVRSFWPLFSRSDCYPATSVAIRCLCFLFFVLFFCLWPTYCLSVFLSSRPCFSLVFSLLHLLFLVDDLHMMTDRSFYFLHMQLQIITVHAQMMIMMSATMTWTMLTFVRAIHVGVSVENRTQLPIVRVHTSSWTFQASIVNSTKGVCPNLVGI